MGKLLTTVVVVLVAIGALQLKSRYWNTNDEQTGPVVQLSHGGKLRGVVQQVSNGQPVDVFQGVKCGTAKRFEKPKFSAPWSTEYDATKPRESCFQPLLEDALMQAFQSPNQNEDCLFLNVWRPVAQSASLRPVMVWIHGGGFAIGTIFSSHANAAYISSLGDVVVVAINYRLGPFGYLFGDDKQLPGNLGHYDQILGLKWVREHIKSFGGDPNQVTIFGASAGSMSVGTLVLSPLANGLFGRAILHGGAPNSNWHTSKEDALSRTKVYASRLGCTSSDGIAPLVKCLQSKTAQELNSNAPNLFDGHEIFLPIYGDELLPLSPVDALEKGKFNPNIDLLYGTTKDEGSFFVMQMFPKLLQEPASLTVESTKQDIVHLINDVYKESYGEEVAQFYAGRLSKNPTDDDLKIALSNATGDYTLACPTIIFGAQVARHRPQNRFYAYRVTRNFGTLFPMSKWMGVPHGQDSMPLFFSDAITDAQDKQLAQDYAKALISFAKTGAPGKLGSIEWKEAVDRSKAEPIVHYVAINSRDLHMSTEYVNDVCIKFWKDRIQQPKL